jgi:uncharacterized protein
VALDPTDGAVLARLAADTVAFRLAGHELAVPMPSSPTLGDLGASFVTLQVGARLRGCIGTIEPIRPLYLDVIRNAQRATQDPRLPAVSADEWAELDIKVSVLTPPEPVPAGTLADLIAALRPGVDGLLISEGFRRATFLPAVWERLPQPPQFIGALLAKGGWPPGIWPAGLAAHRYTSTEYVAPRPHAALPTIA